MPFEAALADARSDLDTRFVGWARSEVTETQALADIKKRSVYGLRALVRDLESIPAALHNANSRLRLRLAARVLENSGQIHAAARDTGRTPRAPASQVRNVVSGGLPTLGRNR